MGVVRRTVGSLSPQYAIRSYVIAFALFAFFAWMRAQPDPNVPGATGGLEASDYPTLVVLFVGSLLFPFTKLVWDELRDLALGENFVLINAVVMLIAKIFINFMLWFVSIFVAPLGLLYLWWRTRGRAPEQGV